MTSRVLTSARRVLVTGAARGIGEASALEFVARGCTVVALDKEFGECALPSSVERVTYDLRDLGGIKALVKRLGTVDTLVNNAAVLHCPPLDRLRDGELGHTADQAEEILNVNLRAPVALIEALAPQMMTRGEAGADAVGGRVVNIASVSAHTGHPDLWYGASKAGIVNVTKAFAAAMGKSNVLVNAVAPGLTMTAMYETLPQSRIDAMESMTYSGRGASPREIAEVVAWLGTESPSYINGTCHDVNNGFHR